MAGIQRNGSGPGTCSLEVVLAEGRRIEVRRDFDAETLARLIRPLRRSEMARFGLGPATYTPFSVRAVWVFDLFPLWPRVYKLPAIEEIPARLEAKRNFDHFLMSVSNPVRQER